MASQRSVAASPARRTQASGSPERARDRRIGWRLTPAARGDSGFELNLDATRREADNGNEPPEHRVMLRGALSW